MTLRSGKFEPLGNWGMDSCRGLRSTLKSCVCGAGGGGGGAGQFSATKARDFEFRLGSVRIRSRVAALEIPEIGHVRCTIASKEHTCKPWNSLGVYFATDSGR